MGHVFTVVDNLQLSITLSSAAPLDSTSVGAVTCHNAEQKITARNIKLHKIIMSLLSDEQ